MAKCCSVRGCVPNRDVTYFLFPTSRNLRRKWLEAIHVKRLDPEAMVCSEHFTPSDYSVVRGKLRLNGKVVPSVFNVQESHALSPHRTEETEDMSTNTEAIKSSVTEKRKDTEKNTLNHEDCETENENHENGDGNNDDNCDDDKNSDDNFESDKNIVGKCSNGKNKIDGDKNNDAKRDGDMNNDTKRDGDMNNDTKPDGDMNNDTKRDGDINNDTKPDGDINNDTKPDGDMNNDTKRDGDMNNDEVSNKNNVEPDSYITYSNNVSDDDSNKDDAASYCNNEDSTNSHNEDTTGNSNNEDILANVKNNGKNEIEQLDVNTIEKDLRTRKREKKIKLRERKSKRSAEIFSERLPPSSIDISKPTDIEEVLVNFCIPTGGRRDALSCDVMGSPLDLTGADVQEETRFIEVEVDRRDSEDRGDCLMLLESVQCEVDPSSLMMEEQDLEQDCRKDNAISLLTSSDEDDVILEEPHIDTVEVSDETDEDDVPLVKLVKPADKVHSKDGVSWSVYDYYCPHCMFSTNNSNEFKRHRKIHENEDGVKRKRTHIFHVCEVCSYATSSKTQLLKHERSHKDERRFKCRYCEYAAKHRMSLVYHMKNHEGASIFIDKGRVKNVKKGVKCKNCGIRMPKDSAARHKGNCKEKRRHCCQLCDYETTRASDLRRHKRRKHPDECDDEEYLPEN